MDKKMKLLFLSPAIRRAGRWQKGLHGSSLGTVWSPLTPESNLPNRIPW